MCSVLSFLVGNASGLSLLYICKMCFKKPQHPKTKTKAIAMKDNAAYCIVSYHHTWFVHSFTSYGTDAFIISVIIVIWVLCFTGIKATQHDCHL